MLSNCIVAGSGTIWVLVTTRLSKRTFPSALVAPLIVSFLGKDRLTAPKGELAKRASEGDEARIYARLCERVNECRGQVWGALLMPQHPGTGTGSV
jgi:hypothetical protein